MRAAMLRYIAGAGLCLWGAAAHAGSGPRNLEVRIDAEGLRWIDSCKAEIYRAKDRGADATPVVWLENLSEPVALDAGSYEVVVACPSTEGTLKQTQTLRIARKDVVTTIRMRPAFLLARVTRDGNDVPAEVIVTDRFGREVQRGRDKVVMPVPPGDLRVMARVDAAAAKTQRPVLGVVEVRTRPGQKSTPVVDTSDGTLTVSLTSNGKPVEGVAALQPPGGGPSLIDLRVNTPELVPPGVYDVVGQLQDSHDFQAKTAPRVRIYPGKRSVAKLAYETGQVTTTLLHHGKPVSPSQGEIQLFLRGAPVAFNTLSPGDTAILTPGRYRLVGRLLNHALDDGSVLEHAVDVDVRKGRTVRAELDLRAASVQVSTSLGGKLENVDVEVYRKGADVPVVRGKSGRAGQISWQLPAGHYRIVVSKRVPQGQLVDEKSIRLVAGRSLDAQLDLPFGKAVIQVFERGIAVAAEVRFFTRGASAPRQVAPAGQDVYLPPGTYTPAVHRKGREWVFSPIRVAAGGEVERQLELTDPSVTPKPIAPSAEASDDEIPLGDFEVP